MKKASSPLQGFLTKISLCLRYRNNCLKIEKTRSISYLHTKFTLLSIPLSLSVSISPLFHRHIIISDIVIMIPVTEFSSQELGWGSPVCHHKMRTCLPTCHIPNFRNDFKDSNWVVNLHAEHLTRFEVREENVESFTFFTVVTNNNARAADDLSWVTLSVDFAKTSPAVAPQC